MEGSCSNLSQVLSTVKVGQVDGVILLLTSLRCPQPPCWSSGKTSTSRAEGPGFESRLCRDFLGSSHTSDLKFGTPVATLPGAWHYRVSTGTGRPGVSILWLGEVERLICNFCLSVAARIIVWADPSVRYTSLFAGTLSSQQTNKPMSTAVMHWLDLYISNISQKSIIPAPHRDHADVWTLSHLCFCFSFCAP